MDDQDTAANGDALETPRRNAYAAGQVLTPDSLTLEARYGIGQRRLMSRLVSGYGVVCGLGVEVGDGGESLRVLPGVAIDGRGREIVVPEMTAWVPVARDLLAAGAQVHVRISYEECLEDPVPIPRDDESVVVPSTISERYRIELSGDASEQPGPPDPVVALGTRIDDAVLARWVTNRPACAPPPGDPSVPLARVRVVGAATGPRCDPDGIDITVRPVVVSNAMLVELIRAMHDDRHGHHGRT